MEKSRKLLIDTILEYANELNTELNEIKQKQSDEEKCYEYISIKMIELGRLIKAYDFARTSNSEMCRNKYLLLNEK